MVAELVYGIFQLQRLELNFMCQLQIFNQHNLLTNNPANSSPND